MFQNLSCIVAAAISLSLSGGLGFSIKLSAVAFINSKRRALDDVNEVCCMLYLLYAFIGEAIVDYKNISNWLYSAPTAQIICLVLRSFSILT